MAETRESTPSFWGELRQDILANGWNNCKLGTFLRIVFLESSFHTLFLYRLQVRLNRIPVVGTTIRRILTLITGIMTSCEISFLAILEGGVALPHPKGLIIGKGCVVQRGATIYQHVTLGTRAGHGSEDAFPTIKSGAIIYAGAVIVGGITIGTNAIVGANAVVLSDIPDGKTAVGIPARIV